MEMLQSFIEETCIEMNVQISKENNSAKHPTQTHLNPLLAPAQPKVVYDQTFMHGWDLIAGAKVGEINRIIKKTFPADLHEQFTKQFKLLGANVTVVGDLVFQAPELYIKNLSGRQVDLHIPVEGTIKVNDEHFQLGNDTILIATVSLTRIESTLQDRKKESETRYDLNVDLTSPDVLVDLVLKGASAPDLAFLIKVLKQVLQKEIAKKHTFHITSFYLNTDDSKKYQAFIPHLADFTFVRCEGNPDQSNILVLFLTESKEKGTISFDKPLLPANQSCLVMVNNKLFLQYLVMPGLIKTIQEQAKEKSKVPSQISMIAHDATKEAWTIKNDSHIDLDKEHDPWIDCISVLVEDGMLFLYLDVKADATFISIHVDTWNKTWMAVKFKDDKIEVIKDHEDNGHSTSTEWWKWFIAAIVSLFTGFIPLIVMGIIEGITASKVPSLKGKFDSVTRTIEWPFQKTFAIKEIELPGHIVFYMDINV